MSAPLFHDVCHHCRRWGSTLRLHDQGGGTHVCNSCSQDVIGGKKPGTSVAKREAAAKVPCPHCGAEPGNLCKGPGVVRFHHAQRRGVAAALVAAGSLRP